MFYMGPTILYKSEDHNFPFPFSFHSNHRLGVIAFITLDVR